MMLFHQLEHDLVKFNMIHRRPRQSSEQTPAKLYAANPSLMDKSDVVVTWMKDNRDATVRAYWPLNQKTCMDWRDPGKKNFGRDYVKYANSAMLEVETVKKYREELLKKSSAAVYLRQAVVDMWSSHTQTRVVQYYRENKKVTYTGWTYPDMIPLPSKRLEEAPPVDIDQLAESREENSMEAAARQTVAALLHRAQLLSVFAATPGSHYLDDCIRVLLDRVAEVRG
jgi:hypothetical protein